MVLNRFVLSQQLLLFFCPCFSLVINSICAPKAAPTFI